MRRLSTGFAISALTIGELATQAHGFLSLLKRRQERASRHAADDWVNQPSHGSGYVPAQLNGLQLHINAAIPFHEARDAGQAPDDAMAFTLLQGALGGRAVLFYFLHSRGPFNAVCASVVNLEV